MIDEDVIKAYGRTALKLCKGKHWCWEGVGKPLQHYTALIVTAKKRQMIREGWRQCAKEQKKTQFCDLLEDAVLAERKACAEILLDYAGRDDLSDSDQSLLKHLFELIRARGETECEGMRWEHTAVVWTAPQSERGKE